MEFEEGYWWDDSIEEIRFRGRSNSRKVLFRLSQIVINDYFQLSDTKESASNAFEENREWFERVATRLLEEKPRAREIVISSSDLSIE